MAVPGRRFQPSGSGRGLPRSGCEARRELSLRGGAGGWGRCGVRHQGWARPYGRTGRAGGRAIARTVCFDLCGGGSVSRPVGGCGRREGLRRSRVCLRDPRVRRGRCGHERRRPWSLTRRRGGGGGGGLLHRLRLVLCGRSRLGIPILSSSQGLGRHGGASGPHYGRSGPHPRGTALAIADKAALAAARGAHVRQCVQEPAGRCGREAARGRRAQRIAPWRRRSINGTRQFPGQPGGRHHGRHSQLDGSHARGGGALVRHPA